MKMQSSRTTRPWRLALLVALAAVALLGAACSGVVASGQESGNGQPDAGQPSEPGRTPADTGGIVDDGDTPVSDGDEPKRPDGNGSNGGGSIGNAPHEAPDFPTKPALAPIDDLEMLVMESYPPQYSLQIVSGLPSGCASYSHTEVERHGSTITVTVWNNMPADDSQVCTMIYGMHQSAVNLGSDFESGAEYTVKVNDQEITFTAQ